MLPRLDPVVHSDWSEASPLTRKQAEQFDRDGFLVLEDVFSPEEVGFLQKQTNQLLSSPDGLNPETVITEPGSREIRSIFEIHAQSSVVERLAADARLAGVAQFLLDDEVYIHQSRLNYKPGFDGKEFYWHSDFETWHVEDGMPRMRALVDVGAAGGEYPGQRPADADARLAPRSPDLRRRDAGGPLSHVAQEAGIRRARRGRA